MPRRGVVTLALLATCLVARSPRAAAQDVKRGVDDGRRAPDTTGLAASRFHALLIAVQDYSDPTMPKLKSPVGDAEKLRKVLVERYRFDDRDIQTLKNPKRDEIVNAFDSLTDVLGPNDNLIIFYAGHGKWDGAGAQGFWLPVDAKATRRSGWISSDDVNAVLRRMKARHILLIADACFAGAALTREIGDERAMERLYQMPSRKAMTSGANEPVPDKSVFLKYVVQRLAENTDTYLPAGTLFERLRMAVMNNSDVQPLFLPIHNVNDQGGEFLFPLRRAGSAVVVVDADSSTTIGRRDTTTRGVTNSTPRGAVEASVGNFVQSINKKEVQSLGNLYETMPGKPQDWKEKLMVFIREDLISAKIESQEVAFEGADESTAISDVVLSVRYKDPVVAGSHQGKLHILVTHRRFGTDWSLRTFSLVEKPPF